MAEKQTDILIVGGGVGGCAAAMAATSLGNRVVMTEQTSWIGGQLTSQAVPPDEHRWIEHFGCTRRYRAYRDGVRRYYHDHFPLTTHARAIPNLNPGMGRVSRLSHDFRVGVAVLEQMLAFERSAGLLEVMLGRKPVAVETEGDEIRAVTLRNLDTQEDEVVCVDYVIDATELGDLLALAGVEYVSGAESQDQTGEPHAVSGAPQPDNVQAMTWCFPLAFDPKGSFVIDKPEQFERWRYYVPDLKPAWSGRLFSWVHPRVPHLRPWTRCLFDDETDDPAAALWNYRRIHYGGHYPESIAPHEVSVINWPQNDYLEGNIIDRPADEVERYLEEARQLSLSLIYWIQTEAPRPDGGVGYPGLYLRPDLVGTDDGLAMFPYIRESRRIKALFTVTENELSDSYSLERNPTISFEKLLDRVSMGDRDPDTLSSLASRLARLDRQLTPRDRQTIEAAAGGASLHDLISDLVTATDPDAAVEAACEATGEPEPSPEAVDWAERQLLEEAAQPFAQNPELRQTLVDVRRSYEQTIDTVSADSLIDAGFSGEQAGVLVQSFQEFIEQNRDEITALQVLYERPYRQRLSYRDIKELADALQAPPRSWTTDRLWDAYRRLDESRVRGSGQRVLADVVSLVRHAIGATDELAPFEDRVHERFEGWMAMQETAGRDFTPEQHRWLEHIRDHIAGSVSMDVSDFQYAPFNQQGGLARAYELFGDDLYAIIEELNLALAA